MRPVILGLLIAVAIYTFNKKDFGLLQISKLSQSQQWLYSVAIGCVIGFYDGFFGPGTGSFFVLGFVVLLGFEFIQASAYSKVINCMTNISALVVFISKGNYYLELAIIMSVSNISGNYLGAIFALKKGNSFIRSIYLVIVTIMILRYAYDIFFSK
jgi:uncharacterized membrane protein YfcA